MCSSDLPARIGQRVLFKQGARSVHANIASIGKRLNLASGRFEPSQQTETVALNEIVEIGLECARAVLTDSYAQFPRTGAALLLDPLKFDTLAAGIHV